MRLQALELAENQRPVRPGAGIGNIEMVAAALGLEATLAGWARRPVGSDEVAELRVVLLDAVGAVAAPIMRESIPVTAMRLPIAIFVISAGSRNFLDQMRQNMTAMKRKLTETIESNVINHVVGIFFPKKMRLAWSCAQTR